MARLRPRERYTDRRDRDKGLPHKNGPDRLESPGSPNRGRQELLGLHLSAATWLRLVEQSSNDIVCHPTDLTPALPNAARPWLGGFHLSSLPQKFELPSPSGATIKALFQPLFSVYLREDSNFWLTSILLPCLLLHILSMS